MATIVLVDDDPVILSLFKGTLESLDHVVLCAMTCAEVEALLSASSQCIDLMLTDYHLPDGLGLSNIQSARRNNDCAKLILMSADARAKEHIENDVCFLHKPFSISFLKDTVQSILSPINA